LAEEEHLEPRKQFAESMKKIMSYADLSVAEHRELISKAGYSDIQVFEEYDKGWICAIGRKPS
jgi:hypothetical protein